MNLNEAIERHAEWKITFRAAIEKKSQIDADTVRRDNCCVLGKWLHAAGRSTHGHRPAFTELVTAHATFHRNAGEVADAINAKDYETADKLLGVWSAYADASLAVVDAIEALQLEIEPMPEALAHDKA
jgi:methyl-accepting chemotaxis protein